MVWFRCLCEFIFIPHHTAVAGYSDISVSVCPSIRILFQNDNLSKHNGFSPNLVYTCIAIVKIWFGIVSKFHQCFTELSAHDMIMAWYSSLTFLFLCMSFVYSLLLFVHFRLCCGEMGCSPWKYRGCYQGFFKTIKNCQQSEDLTSYKLKEAGERL